MAASSHKGKKNVKEKISDFFRPEPPPWISLPVPGTVQGGPLNVNDERNAYVTGKFGRNCGDNDDQSRIVSDIHLSNGSPVKIYRSMKGKEEEDKKRAMEAKLRKEMEDKLAKERAKEVKKKSSLARLLESTTRGRSKSKSRRNSISSLAISVPIPIDDDAPPMPPLPPIPPTRPNRPPPSLTLQPSFHSNKPSNSSPLNSHFDRPSFTKTNNATPRALSNANSNSNSNANSSSNSNRSTASAQPRRSAGNPSLLTISSIPTTPIRLPTTGTVTPSAPTHHLAALRNSNSTTHSSQSIHGYGHGHGYGYNSGTLSLSSPHHSSTATSKSSTVPPPSGSPSSSRATQQVNKHALPFPPRSELAMEQVVGPRSGGPEYTFVERSIRTGSARGEVPGTVWRDQDGFLHWVGDI